MGERRGGSMKFTIIKKDQIDMNKKGTEKNLRLTFRRRLLDAAAVAVVAAALGGLDR